MHDSLPHLAIDYWSCMYFTDTSAKSHWSNESVVVESQMCITAVSVMQGGWHNHIVFFSFEKLECFCNISETA